MSFRGTTTGPTAEMARRASRIVCVEDFIRDMENRGEDGYFVSSKWLLSLQEHETESLMSVLRRAGYSGTYQTPTTTLFARIQKDDQCGITYNDVPGTSTDTAVRPGDSEVVRYSPKWGDDPSVDLNPGIADISKSETLLLQTVSSKDYGSSILAVPSEAESTPGNVLQQLQNVPREQYEAPDFSPIAEANVKDISELMPVDRKIPLNYLERHFKEDSLPEHLRPGGIEEKTVEARKWQDKISLANRLHKHQQKLQDKREKLRALQQANQEHQQKLQDKMDKLHQQAQQEHEHFLQDKMEKLSQQANQEMGKNDPLDNSLRTLLAALQPTEEREKELRAQSKELRALRAQSEELRAQSEKLRAQQRNLKGKWKGADAFLRKFEEDLKNEREKLHARPQKLKDEWEEFDAQLQKLKDEGEEFGTPLQAHLPANLQAIPKEEERRLLEQRNTEKQPGISYQKIIEQEQISDLWMPSLGFPGAPYDAASPDLCDAAASPVVFDAASPDLFLTEIEEEPQRSVEEETLPGIGEHQGAAWKSFKVPPQSIKEEPHQSIEEETLPVVGEHQGATWKSFKAALQSKSHQSFCVSTQWLSNFKDHEDEALKAGYEKISQTKTATWYQKSRDHHVKSPAGGACDDDSYKVSNRHDGVDGGVNEPGASTSGNFRGQSGPRQSVDNTNRSRNEDVEHKTSSFAVATEMKRTWVQHSESTCHPQLLKVACSSPTHTLTELSPSGHFHKQQFGDSVVTMPGSGAQNISTTIEKPFSVMKIDFSGDGRGREVPVDLKAIATTSLSCCLKDDHDSSKVRIKFSRISGDVKTDDSYEESCNAMVLSSSYTSVYGCIRTNSEDRFEEINLNLEDEYHNPPRRRVLANAPRSSGELATTSVDLVWLEISGRTPNNCEPGSVTLALRGGIAERRKEDSLRQIQAVHPLLFKEPRPVIFGGDVTLPPHWFLEFRIRSQLEVSYFKPWTPISEEGPVWPANDTTKVVDFGCCLAIRAEDLRLHSKKRRNGEI